MFRRAVTRLPFDLQPRIMAPQQASQPRGRTKRGRCHNRRRPKQGICRPTPRRAPLRGSRLASEQELSDFLKSVEKRAFKRSIYHVRDEEAALDIVQDSMMKLAEHYGDKPANELPMLFQRILSNCTLDWFRRQKTRRSLFSNLSDFESAADEGGGLPGIAVFVLAKTFGATTSDAASYAVYFSVGVLLVVGYLTATQAGRRGGARIVDALAAGLFGVIVIIAKALLH